MNSLRVIRPYRYEGLWVFDDPQAGLEREPFVAGADTIIDRAVAHLPTAAAGFNLVFSDKPFPGQTLTLTWRRADCDGNWYHCPQFDIEGWLCPALFKYFATAPVNLYARIG